MARAIAATSPPAAQREAVARLDEAAFSEFYRSTSRALWSYVYRVTGHAADADDIVQESFLRVLRAGLEGGTEEEWRRYLYRVASNLIVDRWRSRSRKDLPEMPRVAERRRDDDEDVARTFSTLTTRERALLWLAYVEEESHEEIAASLGLGRSSIKVLLFRARRRLRDLLKSRGITARASS
jgi:RNA polymerase sigma-70 factor (ECF subfamily)